MSGSKLVTYQSAPSITTLRCAMPPKPTKASAPATREFRRTKDALVNALDGLVLPQWRTETGFALLGLSLRARASRLAGLEVGRAVADHHQRLVPMLRLQGLDRPRLRWRFTVTTHRSRIQNAPPNKA